MIQMMEATLESVNEALESKPEFKQSLNRFINLITKTSRDISANMFSNAA